MEDFLAKCKRCQAWKNPIVPENSVLLQHSAQINHQNSAWSISLRQFEENSSPRGCRRETGEKTTLLDRFHEDPRGCNDQPGNEILETPAQMDYCQSYAAS